MQTALEKLLAAIESSTSEIAETLESGVDGMAGDRESARAHHGAVLDQLKGISEALGRLKMDVKVAAPAVTFNAPKAEPPVIHVNTPKAEPPVVNVAAAKQWTELEVTPHRDTRTGEVISYRIKRVS